MEFIVDKAPHIRRKSSVARMMSDVLIALIPCCLFSIVTNGFKGLLVILVSLITMILCETIFVVLRGKPGFTGEKIAFKEWLKKAFSKWTINNITAPAVSAIIYAMIMPASASWYQVMIGAIFGLVIGKLVFGGTGQNIFNPAAIGRLAAMICFGSSWNYTSNNLFEVSTGGTPLQVLKENLLNIGEYKLLDLFLGLVPGTLGEVSAVCILIGCGYLLLRRSADWRQMASGLVTFVILILVAGLKIGVNAGEFALYHLLSGGFLFGLVFMATDPVTTPVTAPGRMIYGTIVASLVVLIRLFGSYPEGTAFAIVLGNLLTPMVDYYKWSSNKFSWKHFAICGGIIVVLIAVILLAL